MTPIVPSQLVTDLLDSAMLGAAEAAMAAGEHDKALEYALAVLAVNPSHAKARAVLGRCAVSFIDDAAARRLFSVASWYELPFTVLRHPRWSSLKRDFDELSYLVMGGGQGRRRSSYLDGGLVTGKPVNYPEDSSHFDDDAVRKTLLSLSRAVAKARSSSSLVRFVRLRWWDPASHRVSSDAHAFGWLAPRRSVASVGLVLVGVATVVVICVTAYMVWSLQGELKQLLEWSFPRSRK